MEQTQDKIKIECEICKEFYENTQKQAEERSKKKTANGRFLCMACTKKENTKKLIEAGTIALSKISKEDRIKNASAAGKKSAENYNPVTNKTRFSTEMWNSKTKEEQQIQVNRANSALWSKINSDEEFKERYYKNFFGNRKIGYISKAQKEIFSNLTQHNFIMEYQIGKLTVDICNPSLKIVIEYNGDFWHCNPRKWHPDQYNKTIKMYAKEKWNSDAKRSYFLKKLGYTVIIIWESGWKSDKEKYLKRIYDEIDRKRINTKTDLL